MPTQKKEWYNIRTSSWIRTTNGTVEATDPKPPSEIDVTVLISVK